VRPRPKPPKLPLTPPPPEYQQHRDPTLVLLLLAFSFAFCSIVVYAACTHVSVTMKRGAAIPPPECGWSATLVCDDVPGVECRWDRRWRCGYGVPWPNVVVRRPLAEEIVKERYP
jgi:hypothetical protein